MPLLLTPGPLTTAPEVREAMLVDRGSRDPAFVELGARVRARLEALLPGQLRVVPVQGSGTFAVEAMLQSFVPRGGRVLLGVNGAYGRRMADILRRMDCELERVEAEETQPLDPQAFRARLARARFDALAVVHCETTTGVLNPLADIGAAARAAEVPLLVDAMSSLGSCPVPDTEVSALASSANKGLAGVPGLAWVGVDAERLAAARGAPALALDLRAQLERLDADGQWRFTPPTHVLAGLDAALERLDAEGGLDARHRRARACLDVLLDGMAARGFPALVERAHQAPVIATFGHEPDFDFEAIYRGLEARGFAIYPGKLSSAPSFRVGVIGDLQPPDIHAFLDAFDAVRAGEAPSAPSASPAPPRVEAVVFDWAGTTVDHGCLAPARAFVELFRRRGVEVSDAEARGPMGMHKREHIRVMLELPRVREAWRDARGAEPTEADLDALYAEVTPLQVDLLAEYAEPIPGVLELMAELARRGIRVGSSTGYNRAMLEEVQRAARAHGFAPELALSSEDVPRGRPAPYMLWRAAEALGVTRADRIVAVGDTVTDMGAARAAGCWAVGVALTGNVAACSAEELAQLEPIERDRLRGRARELLFDAGADDVVDGVHELPRALERIERRLAAGGGPGVPRARAPRGASDTGVLRVKR